jgi:hypothetical protein
MGAPAHACRARPPTQGQGDRENQPRDQPPDTEPRRPPHASVLLPYDLDHAISPPADSSLVGLVHDLSDHYREEAKRSQRPSERIFLAHAIIALCRAQKSRIADDLMCVVTHQLESEGLRRDIPDVALDRHTQRGKRQGRGWDHWVEEGCRVVPETVGMNVYQERATAARKQYGPIQATRRGRPNPQGSLLPDEEDS